MKLPTKIIENVVNEISKLPGIGKKTALRLSLFLLKKDLEFSKNISKAIIDLKEKTTFCKVCHMICEDDNCSCQDDNSLINKKILCVVEDTPDALAIQNTNHYNGLFHVIGGLISPIDGIGPENLNIESLVKRVDEGEINEIIFALSPTLDGDTTSFYISKKLSKYNLKITTISRGIPIGGEIEYADEITLGKSISSRINYNLEQ
ncbi:MAG: recombination protein RecR [Flammeovirgaceae bacterium]|nr:recombination protein RecR [Flammeovirgaceae bacterium]|tara:strand:- start:2805 stop:3419 length:615 start_codon:yes stop_codon:yes gene_type:complete